MKKSILAAILLAATFTSCDMDLEPKGAIIDTEAMETPDDVEAFRNGIYSNLRGVTSGAYVTYTEVQMDQFLGLVINGNVQGDIASGNIYSNNSDLNSIWANLYAVISRSNYFLEQSRLFIDSYDEATAEEYAQLERYRAEVFFARAYYYYYLADHFAPAYTAENANTPALGLPLQLVYNPTANTSAYPSRSTLAETYRQIHADLDSAYVGLKEFEDAYPEIAAEEMNVSNAVYIGTNAVRCLQARIALLQSDWQAAYDYADAVIATKNYSLINPPSKLSPTRLFAPIWTQDTGTELILRMFANADEAGGVSSIGGQWLSSYNDRANYIPTDAAMNMYDGDSDVRFRVFFGNRDINVEGMRTLAPMFEKFPGNEALNTGSENAIKNMPKVFRLPEMYLIKAEAAANLGREDEANAAINTLRRSRIIGYAEQTYSGAVLTQQVRLERNRELIGEGFRMSDLRRWKQGFTRSANYPNFPDYADATNITVVSTRDVTYQNDDHRFTWPIPSTEMEVNPNIAGQQNPGY